MKSVCAFGDSILKGVVLDESNMKYKITQNNFSNLCEKTLGIKIENRGKFGSTIMVGEKSLEKYVDKIKDYEYIVFEFGGNDCDLNWKEISENPDKEHVPNSTIQNFRNTYIKLIEEVKNIGAIPVLLSLPPIDSEKYCETVCKNLNKSNILKWMKNDINFFNNWHERYNIEVFKIAMEQKVSVIDITSRFLECKNYNKYLCKDGIHPNEQGHRIIAEAIKSYVENNESIKV